MVWEQVSPGPWPPSQTLAAFGEPCRNFRMKQLQNSRTDDAQIRMRRLHQGPTCRRSDGHWRMDVGPPAAERLEIEFQRKLYIALSLGTVDYAKFKVYPSVRNVQHWRVCNIEELGSKLQFLGLAERKLFLHA